MAEHHSEPWYPTAAYLYTLHLDGPALAWEYLRRNPDYRLDWLRHRRRSETAHRWGLRLLEDPALDAREAQPAWFPDHESVLQLYPDADPSMDAIVFSFWSLPGSKCLIHDGKRLMLVLRWPGYSLRLAIAPGLADGMAFAYAIRACAQLPGLTAMLRKLANATDASPAATASVRPLLSPLQELHSLQALDATLAGASLREIAEGLFGEDAAADWYSDGGLRSKVRRLVQRGDALMRGGYRRLAQLPPLEKGRSGSRADRP
ncbi:DUF2285 domain-containing protein [Acidovorax cavernicola]|uniref:DUF2285 domain-containing protein n=1 Tax=Acidovorax cavernicola TaxID=1675792 RepID=A0A9X8GS48_9BURK|nr:DUF2285 domain-containing protein [Acidovorax cavernicola]RIX72067.1 DUF2285 domain-containing protein [Acidovorax cavernicola]